jgi:prevent-host-death family protein
MTTVGVRELKRDLSGYLKRAAAGEPIRVTVRGHPAVDLTAVPQVAVEVDPIEAELDRLEKAGKLTRATAPKTKVVLEDLGLSHSPLERILEEREADVWPRRPYPEGDPS